MWGCTVTDGTHPKCEDCNLHAINKSFYQIHDSRVCGWNVRLVSRVLGSHTLEPTHFKVVNLADGLTGFMLITFQSLKVSCYIVRGPACHRWRIGARRKPPFWNSRHCRTPNYSCLKKPANTHAQSQYNDTGHPRVILLIIRAHDYHSATSHSVAISFHYNWNQHALLG